jgi:hypothetical protein
MLRILGHAGCVEQRLEKEHCLLGYNAVKSVESQGCLSPAFTLVSCSDYSSTLKMEAICSSE